MDRRIARAALLIALAPACNGSVDGDAINATFSQPLNSNQELGILAMVNDCATTLQILDVDAALDVRAARGIAERRNGVDSVCGNQDDGPFTSMSELDAVPWVGDVALAKLLEHAVTHGYVPDNDDESSYDGATFTAEQAAGVLAIANGASFDILDLDVGLDSRAANAILAARPFDAETTAANMQELAAAAYVGKSALERMKSYVENWQACSTEGAVIKGADFSNLQAHDTLDLLNQAPADKLTRITGIGTTIATRIEFERPFESLTQLANVEGVGPYVAGNLRGETETEWCPTPGARCGCPSNASYRPPLITFDENGLYYLLAYDQWGPERSVDSGFISHDGDQVVLTDVEVADDPDDWQQIPPLVMNQLWDCCLNFQFDGEPLEIGPNRKGVLHLGRIINADDNRVYVMAYWQDIDDASFAWLFERDAAGTWTQVGQQFLN